MTQRTYLLFFFENNSKNWLLSKIWFKELNFFLSMTQRIELTFFWIRLNESIPFFWMWLNWNLGWKKKSKNWTFLTQNWTFLHMTRRIEPLFMNLFSIWLKELKSFLQYDSKSSTFLVCSNMTQRIEPFFEFWLQELNFFWLGLTELDPFSWIWLRELKISWFFFMSPRIELFSKMTQRIEPFFLWIWRKELNLFSLNVMSRIWIFLYDAKNWTLLFNMTHSIEPFFSTWLKEWIFFLIDSKKIEPCVKRKVSKSGIFFSEVKNCFLSFSTWLEELLFF